MKKLTSVSLAPCNCHAAIETAGHDKNYKCYCFIYRIFWALLSALIERKQRKLLLFVNKNDYKTISDEILFDSYNIWAQF